MYANVFSVEHEMQMEEALATPTKKNSSKRYSFSAPVVPEQAQAIHAATASHTIEPPKLEIQPATPSDNEMEHDHVKTEQPEKSE